MNVMIIGASDNPERYSYKAAQMLTEYGHQIIPVSPRPGLVVQGIPALRSPADYHGAPVDTVTLYVGESISSKLSEQIEALKPKRVIMNPGAENLTLSKRLSATGVQVVEGCTLVLLRTGQF